MIGIRADANDKIAMGHIMRCMSIAKQLKNLNLDIIFIVSEEYACKFIAQNGFAYLCLNNNYDEKTQETERLIKIVKQKKIDALILDSYEVTFEYMAKIQQVTRLVYIDDMNKFCYPADVIINYTYGTDRSFYKGRDYNENQRLLLGSRYAPLRPEFAQERIQIKKEAASIFITTGGTDEYDIITNVLQKLGVSQLKRTKKYVVTGKFYKYSEKLKAICQHDNTIEVYHDVADICTIMHKADIAISAGGTTLAELCACGIPTICFSMAENQLLGTHAYAQAGLLLYAGNVRNDRESVDVVIDKIVQQAEQLQADPLRRERMGKNAKIAIDGKGACRIAEEICYLIRTGEDI